MARPKRVFSEEELQNIERYARINCNTETIADGLKIPVTTLKRRFGRQLTEWRAAGKLDARANLYKHGEINAQTAIFIAKNELGMTDKQVIETRQEASEVPKGEEKAVKAAAEAYKRAMAIKPYKTGS